MVSGLLFLMNSADVWRRGGNLNCLYKECGKPNAEGAGFCEWCGKSLSSPPPTGTTRSKRVPRPPTLQKTYAYGKSPARAAILSIFPSAGQFYNGDKKRGGIVLGGVFISFFLAAPSSGIGALIGFVIWGWAIHNAYSVAAGKTPLSL